MKRPKSAVPKTTQRARAGAAGSRKDAAIQLVRLEFDLSRLQRSIDQAERRSAADRLSYAEKESQRLALMKILNR